MKCHRSQRLLLLHLLVLTLAFKLCIACHGPTAVTQGPQSINATFGEIATFNCTGHGNMMTWLIDGTDVNSMSTEMVQLRGIQVATTKTLIYIGFGYGPKIYSYSSLLSIIANCITTVQCLIYTCSNRHTASGSLKVEDYTPPSIETIGQNSVFFHLDGSNASYDVTIINMSNGNIATNKTVFGNSNAYKLELENPDPCHLYNVSMELNYHERCIPGITTHLLATFEAIPFEIENESVIVNYRSDNHVVNVSFKLEENLTTCPGKKPSSFLFELTNIDTNSVESVKALTITSNNQDNYTASLGVVLQPNSDYILNIVTQNSVGSSTSGPYKISTHGVQDLIVTVNAQQVCIACVLADWANTNSCQVTIYSEMTQTIKSIMIMSSLTTTLMNCTENIPPGYYHIIAYDTDNVSNPAVKMYHYLNTTLPQVPFEVDKDTVVINYNPDNTALNISFKLLGNLTIFPGKIPNSFMFQVINIVSSAVDSVNVLPVCNDGNYTASLGVVLQPNSDYILNIVTQNSVGSSISGPFEFSTHEVQDLVVTVNAQQVCIACVLADWANTNSCQVTIYSEMTQTIKSITIMSSSTTTLMNCTENIPPGYYHIIAYDTDNVSNPAVKMYHNLNTTLPQVEPQLTSTVKSMRSQTTMIINTAPATASESIQQIGLLAGIAGLAAISLLAVTLLLAMCVCICCSRCRQPAKSAPDESSAAVCADEKMEIYEEVEMDTNNTYEAINI